MTETLSDLLRRQPREAVALLAPEREAMTYGGLADLCTAVMTTLRAAGLGAGNRLALVLPNGPDMAAGFVAVANALTAAPLNPAYTEDEFRFYLEDLRADALLTDGAPSPVRRAAAALGLPIYTLTPGKRAGDFTIAAERPIARTNHTAGPALVMHTSGTTARPKLVLLSTANLLASAQNIRRSLRLSPADRGLNIMPLFHIHGLVAGLLAPLAAGGSIFCTPGFNALKFFGWLAGSGATWFTGVPTMHQAILARADRNRDIIAAHPLRFIRSSSASLPAPVFEAMEQAFGCPVIEAYAMTENAHQMTSNDLPPGQRRPGMVGRAAGPEVAIMAEDGRLLPAGELGEVVTRGANVTEGYENNPAANASAFAHGWFHTGDQGVMDEDGFLRLTGRLKELINRGGEKISPLEVDAVLLAHPAVAQALCFALPHDTLGEEVAAAIVSRAGQAVTEREVQDFARTRLAAFKVPKRVIMLEDIPKGPTGKLQRIGLAQKLGLA
jgi:acyl-CoA synthetase (AMP-forming)/AMP-acid ligase II